MRSCQNQHERAVTAKGVGGSHRFGCHRTRFQTSGLFGKSRPLMRVLPARQTDFAIARAWLWACKNRQEKDLRGTSHFVSQGLLNVLIDNKFFQDLGNNLLTSRWRTPRWRHPNSRAICAGNVDELMRLRDRL